MKILVYNLKLILGFKNKTNIKKYILKVTKKKVRLIVEIEKNNVCFTK